MNKDNKEIQNFIIIIIKVKAILIKRGRINQLKEF